MSPRCTDAVECMRHSAPRSIANDAHIVKVLQRAPCAGWTGLGVGLGLLWLDRPATVMSLISKCRRTMFRQPPTPNALQPSPSQTLPRG